MVMNKVEEVTPRPGWRDHLFKARETGFKELQDYSIAMSKYYADKDAGNNPELPAVPKVAELVGGGMEAKPIVFPKPQKAAYPATLGLLKGGRQSVEEHPTIPIETEMATPLPDTKQPWEMTRNEYENHMDEAYLYHATEPENIPSILKEGLIAGKSRKFTADERVEGDNVYGFPSIEKARDFAYDNNMMGNHAIIRIRKGTYYIVPDTEYDIGEAFVIKGSVKPSDVIDVSNYHESLVAQALSEGKPVPAEVLKDYPEVNKPIKVMGEPSRIMQKECVDGIDYELYKSDIGDSGITRIYDKDAAELVTVKKYPNFERAKTEYDNTIKALSAPGKANQASIPDTKSNRSKLFDAKGAKWLSVKDIIGRPSPEDAVERSSQKAELTLKGQYNSREPLEVWEVERDDGSKFYSLRDGNTTFEMLNRQGWNEVPVNITKTGVKESELTDVPEHTRTTTGPVVAKAAEPDADEFPDTRGMIQSIKSPGLKEFENKTPKPKVKPITVATVDEPYPDKEKQRVRLVTKATKDKPVITMTEVEQVQAKRSERSRKMDAERSNKNVRTLSNAEPWLRHPDRYDLQGVDTPKQSGSHRGLLQIESKSGIVIKRGKARGRARRSTSVTGMKVIKRKR